MKTKMDKSIEIQGTYIYSPRFKPWAIIKTKPNITVLTVLTSIKQKTQFDQLVYQLHGLASEEIAIIENSVK